MESPEQPGTSIVLVTDVTPPEAETEMRVIRILPDSRYAIVLPETATQEECERVGDDLLRWLESDHQFCVLHGVKLVRLTDPMGLAEADDDDGG